jgi:TorA maturation chaperone TorD
LNAQAQARALIRADVWNLLAGSFSRPQAASLKKQAAVADDLLSAPEMTEHSLSEALAAFAEIARAADERELEPEFHQLFTTQMLCPPHEGAYHRTSRGAVLGDITAFYEAFGLRARETGGAADSLSHELNFLAWMAIKEAHAIHQQSPTDVEVTRNATRGFLTDHLGRWAASFVDRLTTATPNPYYAAAARLLMDALNAFTGEFSVRDVPPLSDEAPAEPDIMPCPAAGSCAINS